MKSTKARLVQILLINFKINILYYTFYPMDSKCTNRKEIMHRVVKERGIEE